jgi:hypothetical protein
MELLRDVRLARPGRRHDQGGVVMQQLGGGDDLLGRQGENEALLIAQGPAGARQEDTLGKVEQDRTGSVVLAREGEGAGVFELHGGPHMAPCDHHLLGVPAWLPGAAGEELGQLQQGLPALRTGEEVLLDDG